MRCPMCRVDQNEVINSRPGKNDMWWRRRECLSCGFRWTTTEKYDYKTLEEVEEWKKSMN